MSLRIYTSSNTRRCTYYVKCLGWVSALSWRANHIPWIFFSLSLNLKYEFGSSSPRNKELLRSQASSIYYTCILSNSHGLELGRDEGSESGREGEKKKEGDILLNFPSSSSCCCYFQWLSACWAGLGWRKKMENLSNPSHLQSLSSSPFFLRAKI